MIDLSDFNPYSLVFYVNIAGMIASVIGLAASQRSRARANAQSSRLAKVTREMFIHAHSEPNYPAYIALIVARSEWCAQTCTGRYSLADPDFITVEDSVFGHAFEKAECSPPSFIFELDDDAVLYRMRWEGSE